MAKRVSETAEGAFRKLKTEVMDPQINQKNEEIKALKTEISLRDEQVYTLLSSFAELEKSTYAIFRVFPQKYI